MGVVVKTFLVVCLLLIGGCSTIWWSNSDPESDSGSRLRSLQMSGVRYDATSQAVVGRIQNTGSKDIKYIYANVQVFSCRMGTSEPNPERCDIMSILDNGKINFGVDSFRRADRLPAHMGTAFHIGVNTLKVQPGDQILIRITLKRAFI